MILLLIVERPLLPAGPFLLPARALSPVSPAIAVIPAIPPVAGVPMGVKF